GACKEQKEMSEKEAVLILESGATLKNAIIGANQAEDAITIKQTSGTTYITGGGARHAEDKV
ncbi:unnamed protein product, partial [Rotaria sp. Silwood1]